MDSISISEGCEGVEREKSCFFIGSRYSGEELFPSLCRVVEEHIIRYGVKNFYVGHRGNFDRLAALSVMQAKIRHPQVKLILVLAYPSAANPSRYPSGFDSVLYPWDQPLKEEKGAIIRTNQYMVDSCSFLIAHPARQQSNSSKLAAYARKASGPRITLL